MMIPLRLGIIRWSHESWDSYETRVSSLGDRKNGLLGPWESECGGGVEIDILLGSFPLNVDSL